MSAAREGPSDRAPPIHEGGSASQRPRAPRPGRRRTVAERLLGSYLLVLVAFAVTVGWSFQALRADASDAEALAAQIKAAAEQEAVQVVSGAQEQANTVVQQAHAQGKALLDDAAQKAAAVNQGAEARMLKVPALHGETLQRLTEVHSVTGGLLTSEAQRGSLDDEVQRLLGAR